MQPAAPLVELGLLHRRCIRLPEADFQKVKSAFEWLFDIDAKK
jgi:hypothetical protein